MFIESLFTLEYNIMFNSSLFATKVNVAFVLWPVYTRGDTRGQVPHHPSGQQINFERKESWELGYVKY